MAYSHNLSRPPCSGTKHEFDRIAVLVRFRPGDSGHSNSNVGRSQLEGAKRHRFSDFLAHRPFLLQELEGNA